MICDVTRETTSTPHCPPVTGATVVRSQGIGQGVDNDRQAYGATSVAMPYNLSHQCHVTKSSFDRASAERIIPDAYPARYINIGGGIS
jgi:hypothetical protein